MDKNSYRKLSANAAEFPENLKKGLWKNLFVKDEYKLNGLKTPIDTVVDIGANIGAFSIIAHEKLSPSKIIAVEPDKDVFSDLKANTTKLPMEHINAAIGHYNGPCRLIERCLKTVGSIYRPDIESPEGVEVQSITIDKVMEKASGNIFLKVDCEGGEDFIFVEDYLEVLNKAKVIVVEIHNWSAKDLEDNDRMSSMKSWIQDNLERFDSTFKKTGRHLMGYLVKKTQ